MYTPLLSATGRNILLRIVISDLFYLNNKKISTIRRSYLALSNTRHMNYGLVRMTAKVYEFSCNLSNANLIM